MHADDDEHQSPDTNGRAQQFSLTEGQECVTTTDRDGQHPEQHVTTDSPDPQQQPKVLAAEEGRSQLMLQVEVIDAGIGLEPHTGLAIPRSSTATPPSLSTSVASASSRHLAVRASLEQFLPPCSEPPACNVMTIDVPIAWLLSPDL